MRDFINLNLFGEESGDNGQAAAATTGDNGQAAAVTGVQEQAAAAEETFDSLVEKGGKYKADFDRRVQGIVRETKKEMKAQKAQLDAVSPILQTLATKYGKDFTDIQGIAEAVAADDSYIEDAAYNAGMTVDQYRRMEAVKQENERLRAAQEEAARQAAAQQQIAIWQQEEQALKAEFPEFSMEELVQNDQARRLLQNGVSLRNAYVALNADGILGGAMAYTAQRVAQNTANTIASRGNGPRENGLSGQAASTAKVDVSKLTNDQIAELHRRALMGESISF